MKTNADQRWHSVAEIAEHLGVAQITVYRWVESEKIPAHRVGRQWRFQLSEIDDWVRKGGAGESHIESSRRQRTASRETHET